MFAAIFFGLWRAEPRRKHLVGFGLGFLALCLAMTFHIAFVSWNTAVTVAAAHGLVCLSIIAIIWGACRRLGQRLPLALMVTVAFVSAVLLYLAMATGKASVALSVQNASSGLLFAIGGIALWIARPSGILDRVLLWAISANAAFGLLRPVILFLLDVDVERVVQRQTDFNALTLIIMTILTVVLGLSLVALALREALEIRLKQNSADAASGFLDQRAFERSCEAALAKARNLELPSCLAIVRLDWFESITEKWGSSTSESLVRQLADVARDWRRESDVIGRVGEDRLGILLVGSGSRSGLKALQELRGAADLSFNDGFAGLGGFGGSMKFTVSISIVQSRPELTFARLFVQAAQPLESARARSGNITFLEGNEVPASELLAAEGGNIGSLG